MISLEKYKPKEWENWISEKETIVLFGEKDSVTSLANDSSRFWLIDKREPNHIMQVNIPLEKLTFSSLLDIQYNLEIGNHIVFKSSDNLLEDIKQSKSSQASGLTESQLNNLEKHLIKLYTQHKAYHNRDFLTKANQWLSEKMESKSAIFEKFK